MNFFQHAVAKGVVAVLLGLATVGLPSCRPAERGVITDSAPFFSQVVPYDDSNKEKVILTVKKFSDRQGFNFLVADKSLEPGNFNASANGDTINLKAMHLAEDKSSVQIFGIVKGTPSPADKALAEKFTDEVREAAR